MRFLLVVLSLFSCLVSLDARADDQQNLVQSLVNQAPGIKPEILQYALHAKYCASKQGLVQDEKVLTVIDYSLPSTEKRLWTFDLQTHRVLFNEFVAHGKNSGENKTVGVSNQEGSLMTSVGVYLTANPYIGKNGYSLRLVGLEKGFNDNVYSRAVVLHGAWYVSTQMIHDFGRLGRSYGCPAVRKEIATPLINTIKEGSVLFAYYPETHWLKSSRYLSGC